MKVLIVILTVFSMSQTFAQNRVELRNGDLTLTQATAKIVSVREMCPSRPGQVSCAAYGSVVTLEVSLNGCLDRLGGYFTHFSTTRNQGIIYFGGVNINTRASITARCIKAPTTNVIVTVPYIGDIKLVNLEHKSL